MSRVVDYRGYCFSILPVTNVTDERIALIRDLNGANLGFVSVSFYQEESDLLELAERAVDTREYQLEC